MVLSLSKCIEMPSIQWLLMGRVLFSGSHLLSRCSPAPSQESLGYANVYSGAGLNDTLAIHQDKLQHHHVETVVLSLPSFF